MERVEREEQHWRAQSGDLEKLWGWGTPAGKERVNRRCTFFIERGGMRPGLRALELGCGTGLFLREVAKSGVTLTGCDLMSRFLHGLYEWSRESHVTVERQDAHRMSYGSDSFDVVYGSSILHHLDIGRAISEIYRVLRPGGRIVFCEPNMLNPQVFLQKNLPWLKAKMGDSPDETAFVRWRLIRDLRYAGFREVFVRPFDFLHPLTPRDWISAVNKVGMVLEKIPIVREMAGSLLITATK